MVRTRGQEEKRQREAQFAALSEEQKANLEAVQKLLEVENYLKNEERRQAKRQDREARRQASKEAGRLITPKAWRKRKQREKMKVVEHNKAAKRARREAHEERILEKAAKAERRRLSELEYLSKHPFRLLDLPIEVREMIYGYTFGDALSRYARRKHTYDARIYTGNSFRTYLALLRSCLQVCHEVQSYFRKYILSKLTFLYEDVETLRKLSDSVTAGEYPVLEQARFSLIGLIGQAPCGSGRDLQKMDVEFFVRVQMSSLPEEVREMSFQRLNARPFEHTLRAHGISFVQDGVKCLSYGGKCECPTLVPPKSDVFRKSLTLTCWTRHVSPGEVFPPYKGCIVLEGRLCDLDYEGYDRLFELGAATVWEGPRYPEDVMRSIREVRDEEGEY